MMAFRSLWLALALVPGMLASPAFAQTNPRQFVVVYVELLPADTIKGAQKLEQLAGLAQKSTGFIRFDVNQQIGRPNFFSLVEVWRDDAAYQKFLAAARVTAVLDALGPLLEAPLDTRPGNLVE
jgi:quinol monooxygenase YgiN